MPLHEGGFKLAGDRQDVTEPAKERDRQCSVPKTYLFQIQPEWHLPPGATHESSPRSALPVGAGRSGRIPDRRYPARLGRQAAPAARKLGATLPVAVKTSLASALVIASVVFTSVTPPLAAATRAT